MKKMKVCIRIVRDEQGRYLACCPSLPGCVTRGNTREDAQKKLDQAIRGYMAAINNFVPEHLIQEVVEAEEGQLIA